MARKPRTRRALLRASGVAVASGVAGCSVLDGGAPPVRTEAVALVPDSDEPVTSVALSGDGTTVLLGAGDDRPGVDDTTFSAHAFSRDGEGWRDGRRLAADGSVDSLLGQSVALSNDGTTALVGAPNGKTPGVSYTGAAYVFSRAGGEWHRRTELVAADGDIEDEFGLSVALSGDGTAAFVGAPADEDPNGGVAGSAYAFSLADGEWRQRAKVAAADGDPGDYFGCSVALSDDGTTAVVGAGEDEDPNGTLGGSTYAFSRVGGRWRQRAKVAPDDGRPTEEFGTSVALSTDGTTALVGSRGDGDANGPASGAAYAFSRTGGEWRQRAKLAAADGDPRDAFGFSVALSGDGTTAVVGAPADEDPNGESGGSASVFSLTDGEWRQRAKLVAPDGGADAFGHSVALSADGTTAAVGARGDSPPADVGSSYVFEL
jgi:hypothetical protein